MTAKTTTKTSAKSHFLKWFSSNIYLAITAVIQLGGFIILGRALGATEYGTILAVTVFVSLGVEFVGLGCGDSLIKKTSTEKEIYPQLIRESIKLCALTLPPVAAILICLVYFFTDSSLALIGILVVTELYSTRFLALIDHSAIGRGDITYLNRSKLAFATVRLVIVAIACQIFEIDTAWQWIPYQLICTLGVTTILFLFTVRRFGGVSPQKSHHIQLKESILFSLTQTCRALQANMDKYSVQLIYSPLVFAHYAVAGRFFQYSLIPLQAVLRMSYPRFFRAEKERPSGSFTLAVKMIPIMIATSSIPFIFLYWCGFIIEHLLGESYVGVSQYMKLLAPLPVLLGLQYIFMDMLTALDIHKTRLYISLCQIVTSAAFFYSFRHLNISDLILGFLSITGLFVGLYFLAGYIKTRKVIAQIEKA